MILTEAKKEVIAKELRNIISKNHERMKESSARLLNCITEKARNECRSDIAQAREKNILACVAMSNLYLGLPPPRELKLQ
jgi:vacuolar-type H+-ATPase subunit E/Vma4